MEANNQVYDQRVFNDQQISCSKCGWSGTGAESHVSEFFGIGNSKEVLCPLCDGHIGQITRGISNNERPRSEQLNENDDFIPQSPESER